MGRRRNTCTAGQKKQHRPERRVPDAGRPQPPAEYQRRPDPYPAQHRTDPLRCSRQPALCQQQLQQRSAVRRRIRQQIQHCQREIRRGRFRHPEKQQPQRRKTVRGSARQQNAGKRCRRTERIVPDPQAEPHRGDPQRIGRTVQQRHCQKMRRFVQQTRRQRPQQNRPRQHQREKRQPCRRRKIQQNPRPEQPDRYHPHTAFLSSICAGVPVLSRRTAAAVLTHGYIEQKRRQPEGSRLSLLYSPNCGKQILCIFASLFLSSLSNIQKRQFRPQIRKPSFFHKSGKVRCFYASVLLINNAITFIAYPDDFLCLVHDCG